MDVRARPTRFRTDGHAGLTLIEILIVIVLIAILATVAVPMLLRSRAVSNEISAIDSLKAVFREEVAYFVANRAYATLPQLRQGSALNSSVAAGEKDGYRFEATVDADSSRRGDGASAGAEAGGSDAWHVEAIPLDYGRTGVRSFYIDEGGVVRGKDGGESPAVFKTRSDASVWPPVE